MKVAIQARLKNGILYEAAKKMGSASALARFLEVSASELGAWVNFGGVPSPLRTAEGFKQKGGSSSRDWDAIEIKLLTLTGHTLDEIFPAEIRGEKFLKQQKRVETFVEMPVEQLIAAGAVPQLPPAPDELLFQEEGRGAIQHILNTLKPRYAKVVKMRYGLEPYDSEYTFEEIAQDMRVTRERVRQMVIKALGKIRQPALRKHLRPFV